MLNEWCVMFLIISRHFSTGPGLFLSFNWPLSASFSRKYSLYMHCSLLCPLLFSAVYNYIILLMPHYCTEIILWRFITYWLLLFIKTFHSKLIQVFNFFFTFQFHCLHNLCLLFTFLPLFFFLWTFTGWTCGAEFRG